VAQGRIGQGIKRIQEGERRLRAGELPGVILARGRR
jgi:hypothetical protein